MQLLNLIQSRISDSSVSEELMAEWSKKLTRINSDSVKCVTDSQAELDSVKSDLASLGTRLEDEDKEVSNRRSTLNQQQQAYEKTLANCQVRSQLSQNLLNTVSDNLNSLRAQRLTARGPSVLDILLSIKQQQLQVLYESTKSFLRTQTGFEQLGLIHAGILVILMVLMLRLGVRLRLFTRGWVQERPWSSDMSSCLSRNISISLSHYAVYILPSLVLVVYLQVLFESMQRLYFVELVANGLLFLFIGTALLRTLIWPPMPGESCFTLPLKSAQALARRLEVLLLLLFVAYLLFSSMLQQSLPENSVLLVRAVYAFFLIVNLVWITRILGEFPTFTGTVMLRFLVQIILLAVLVVEWSGYRNLSFTILKLMYGSLLVFGLTLLLSYLTKDFVDGLEFGRRSLHRKIRDLIGIKAGEELPGHLWFRFIFQSGLWLMFAASIVYLWGFSDLLLPKMEVLFWEGFTLGSLKVVPSRIILAIVSFSVLILVNSWFKARLEHKWVSKLRMGRGGQDTVVTIAGYIGVTLAVLVALGIAGITFTNIAIIAGALSLGIGFGLQNVVHNFVSGLILLFERQIKIGDWVSVGNTEGYVKRIRIRSTLIQTFDRADVIVPNSELISGQVKNWMLYDSRGRIELPVAVAYGSDTDNVKDVLLAIAKAHPQILTESVSLPKVLFTSFGDSALNFVLRCYVDNIDERSNIVSDLNFAINKAFKEHNIEIPFPQRDVHLRETP